MIRPMNRNAIMFLGLMPLLAMSGCVPATVIPLTAALGADVAIFHRTMPDTLYSAITGKDCSLVRLDRGESYCKAVDPPVPPQPYCTHTLGAVMCWSKPESMPGIPTQIAQGSRSLTPEQNKVRLARWPQEFQ